MRKIIYLPHLYPINGAVHQVDGQDTAWGYPDANFAQVIVDVDPDPDNFFHVNQNIRPAM